MFDFVDNVTIRVFLEITMFLLTGIFSFLGGIKYCNKKNSIKTIKNSTINTINQENK